MLTVTKMIIIIIASFFAAYGIIDFWIYALGKFQIKIDKKQKWWIMGAFFKPSFISRILLSSTLAAFSLISLPTPCYAQINTNTANISFAYRIEQLIERIR